MPFKFFSPHLFIMRILENRNNIFKSRGQREQLDWSYFYWLQPMSQQYDNILKNLWSKEFWFNSNLILSVLCSASKLSAWQFYLLPHAPRLNLPSRGSSENLPIQVSQKLIWAWTIIRSWKKYNIKVTFFLMGWTTCNARQLGHQNRLSPARRILSHDSYYYYYQQCYNNNYYYY